MAITADLAPHSAAVLLTGFGPFPGMPENASAALVRALSARARVAFKNYRFHAAILPTEWHAAPERVSALISKLRPALALHFGVAKDAEGFRIETRGLNQCRMTADAAGRLPPAPVLIADAPEYYGTALPLDGIVGRLRELQLPVSTSDDAGGYLCNSVLYHTLHGSAPVAFKAGFVHIPSSLAASGLSFEDAVTGSLEMIRIALDDLAASTR